jgi:two-component system cell cycle response regulator
MDRAQYQCFLGGVQMEHKINASENGIYWIGADLSLVGLNANPYLIVDDQEAVLIDPGSVVDFKYVVQNVRDIIPIEKIKYVILHHQDPDFCSAVPLFEKLERAQQVPSQHTTEKARHFFQVIFLVH